MTRVAMMPFFSQQHKGTKKFLLDSDNSMKRYLFMAEAMIEELNWDALIITPHHDQWATGPDTRFMDPATVNQIEFRGRWTPPENLEQRLHWVPSEWRRLTEGCDLLLTEHEIAAGPMARTLECPVHLLNGVPPEEPWPWMTPMFYVSWQAVAGLSGFSQAMQEHITRHLKKITKLTDVPRSVTIWPFAFDCRRLDEDDGEVERDIDVLFVQRCSATNYTHHREFIKAVQSLKRMGQTLRIGFTDVTHYLDTSGELPGDLTGVWRPDGILSQREYVALLRRSRAVIAMQHNYFGGAAFREAIYCGAFPIAADAPGYRELLGEDWPGLIAPISKSMSQVDPLAIAVILNRCHRGNYWDLVSTTHNVEALNRQVRAESFQGSWVTAAQEMGRLVHGR